MGWGFRILIKEFSGYEGNRVQSLIDNFTEELAKAIMKDYDFPKETAILITSLTMAKWMRFEDAMFTAKSMCELLYMQYTNIAFENSLKDK